jgi:hypothetical protein
MKALKCLGCRGKGLTILRAMHPKYGGLPDCQRTRKTAWQQNNRTSNPDYLKNLRDVQKRKQEKHPECWSEYRKNHSIKISRRPFFQVAKCDDSFQYCNIISINYVLSFLIPAATKTDTFHVRTHSPATGVSGVKSHTTGRVSGLLCLMTRGGERRKLHGLSCREWLFATVRIPTYPLPMG